MTQAVAAAGRRLPRGWAHLWLQVAIWFGFLGAYQLARGFADRDPARAFSNGLRVIAWEQTHAHHLIELGLQQFASSSRLLEAAVSWTYWNSEFTVIGLTLLYVYLRYHSAFARFRNTILLANALGLIGYVLVPTAPPRMFPGFGFTDTLGSIASRFPSSAVTMAPTWSGVSRRRFRESGMLCMTYCTPCATALVNVTLLTEPPAAESIW